MIYDCFLFNDELDLLELRLNFLHETVGKFVLVESTRTLSGKTKPLHYENNKSRFEKYAAQIIHLVAPVNDLPAWDYEYFQRNYFKYGLAHCKDNDIIFISDADEIINIPAILEIPNLKLPAVIELPMYYYFMNMRTSSRFFVNLAAPAAFIKRNDIGLRYKRYESFCESRIYANQVQTGWHFSYLFGYNIEKYQEKIRSFSHQEYNTDYWLRRKRIRRCIQFNVDLFERAGITMNPDNNSIVPLLSFVKNTPLENVWGKPAKKPPGSMGNLLFILRKKYFNNLRHRLFHPKGD
jgi:beta-1,4-mannosyl-glycoprotein beta-1,4-N-acetylglucosaminyltransferase